MFTFCIENHEPFEPLTKKKLDKNKSIVSRLSVFVVYKSVVTTVQKKQLCSLFQFSSLKSTKLHFQSWKKISPTISLFFRKMTVRYQEITVPNGVRNENSLDIF